MASGLVGRPGLMREEDQRSTRIAPRDRAREIGAVSRIHTSRLVVVDAGQVNDVPVAPQLDVLVAQHAYAESTEVLAPRARTSVVLVVTRDEIGAVGGGQVG